jgi:hypothetical protein
MSKQVQDLLALYQRTDLKSDEARKKLAEAIDASTLPAYTKEVARLAMLSKSDTEVVLGIQLMRRQEELRHADALLKIETAFLGARIRR